MLIAAINNYVYYMLARLHVRGALGAWSSGRFYLFSADKLKKKEEARKLRESLGKKEGGGH